MVFSYSARWAQKELHSVRSVYVEFPRYVIDLYDKKSTSYKLSQK